MREGDMETEACYGQLVADSSEETGTVYSSGDVSVLEEEEVMPQDSYLTPVLSDRMPRRATPTAAAAAETTADDEHVPVPGSLSREASAEV